MPAVSTKKLSVEEVWRLYQAKLYRLLLRQTDNKADAEDVLQEVMIQVHRNLNTLKEQDKLIPWLYQITRHALVDHYRSRQWRIDRPSSLADNMPEVVGSDDTEGTSILAELADCLMPIIQTLPEKAARLLISADIHGVSQKALAEQEGISYPTLKSRIQRARKSLRKAFDQCCEFETDRRGRIAEAIPRQRSCSHCPPRSPDY